MNWPLANDYLDVPTSCKWSSGCAGLIQMIILINRPLTNDHQDHQTNPLQTIIWIGRPLAKDYLDKPANDNSDRPASCNWSSGWTGLWQTIILMDQPLANDYLDRPAFCKWLSWSTDLPQMIIWIDQPLAYDQLDGSAFCRWSTGWKEL